MKHSLCFAGAALVSRHLTDTGGLDWQLFTKAGGREAEEGEMKQVLELVATR